MAAMTVQLFLLQNIFANGQEKKLQREDFYAELVERRRFL
jgi:hypothetical protein